MPSPNPGTDIAAALVAATPVGGVALVLSPTSGANVFVGPPQPVLAGSVPAQAVFCLAYGGTAPPMPYLDGSGQDWHQSRVQLTVRSEQGDFPGGETLARAVLRALHRAAVAGYTWIISLDSEPIYIAKDEQGCHRWTINVECGWKG